jgi:glucose/arabinose dehydrogenase
MVRRAISPAITAALLVAVSLALIAGGCGDVGGSSTTSLTDGTSVPGPGTGGGPATTADTTTSEAATTSSSPAPSSSPSSTLVEGGYRATTVVQNLRVPWEMRFLPDGRLLMTEREGRIVLADVGSGSVTEVGRIDAAARGESGLMG